MYREGVNAVPGVPQSQHRAFAGRRRSLSSRCLGVVSNISTRALVTSSLVNPEGLSSTVPPNIELGLKIRLRSLFRGCVGLQTERSSGRPVRLPGSFSCCLGRCKEDCVYYSESTGGNNWEISKKIG